MLWYTFLPISDTIEIRGLTISVEMQSVVSRSKIAQVCMLTFESTSRLLQFGWCLGRIEKTSEIYSIEVNILMICSLLQ